jgi:glycosyltransferase involved in cell wall biosynthesis
VAATRKLARLAARSIRAAAGASRAATARLGGLPPRGEIRVSYGHARVPRLGDLATGGIVKLQNLVEKYPSAPRRFNVLYLVSSRLPESPVALARAARAKGAAVVVNQNGVAYPAWHGAGWERTNAPMAALLEQASHVFYQSQFCKDTADRFLRVQPRRSEILYNAVDTRRFAPPSSSRSHSQTRLLLGGSQDAWYRVETALRTLALVRRQIKNARLLITGRLRWTSRLTPKADVDALLAELRITDAVDLFGTFTQSEAPSIYHRADILLHTKYNDPCPSVVIEAMASGLPVVYSKSGGVPELVGDAAGLGVAAELSFDRDIPPSPEALADAVCEVASRHEAFRSAARARAVDRFDIAAWVRRHDEVFREVVAL